MTAKSLRSLVLIPSILLLTLPIASLDAVQAQTPVPTTAGCTLRIQVDGLRNSTGWVGSAIYTTSDGWPDNQSKAFRHGHAVIEAGQRQATVVWENLPAGDYGVVVIHDENMNRMLDKNAFGWPKEGFGFANNPHVGLSAPNFKEALVHITCPVTEIAIHMQYK